MYTTWIVVHFVMIANNESDLEPLIKISRISLRADIGSVKLLTWGGTTRKSTSVPHKQMIQHYGKKGFKQNHN